ncbi:TPA: hypothetical protein NGU34_004547 [Vibrio parahaemolyticus]|nr:hypothetical protein [Vibrio parahaemolyticus]
MGSKKDVPHDKLLERLWHEEIANRLGITIYELELIDWYTDEVLCEDGRLYKVRLNIEKIPSDRMVYEKIEKIEKMLNNGRWVYFDEL